MKRKYPKILLPLLLLLVLVPVFCGIVRDRQEAETSVPEDRGVWSVLEEQKTRHHDFRQCDTTSNRLYVAYSMYSCVDVYDHSGTFLYTVQLPKRQNGAVGIRCEGEQVYIVDQDDMVYVFEDRTLIRKLSYDEASSEGYTWDWFHGKEPVVEVQRDRILWMDEQGNMVKQTGTPSALRRTIPQNDALMSISVWVVLAASVYLGGYLLFSRGKNAKSPVPKGEHDEAESVTEGI